MLRCLKAIVATVALGAFLATAAGGQSMGTRLTPAEAVPLDFLDWVDRDADWLRGAMQSAGVRQGFTISDGRLEASQVDALKAANRIRSFAYLAAKGLRPPYFDLSVQVDSRTERCVTLFVRSVVPDIGPMDFATETFSASAADPRILDLCTVASTRGDDFVGLSRQAFRDKYFDSSGNLKVEFVALNTNPGFVAAAIDHGFFVTQGDVTGRLRIEV